MWRRHQQQQRNRCWIFIIVKMWRRSDHQDLGGRVVIPSFPNQFLKPLNAKPQRQVYWRLSHRSIPSKSIDCCVAGLTIFFFWCCWWWLLHPVSSLIIYYTGRVMRDLLYCESIDWLTHWDIVWSVEYFSYYYYIIRRWINHLTRTHVSDVRSCTTHNQQCHSSCNHMISILFRGWSIKTPKKWIQWFTFVFFYYHHQNRGL